LETASWVDRETEKRKYRLQIVAHSLVEISDLREVPTAPSENIAVAPAPKNPPLRNRSARNTRELGGTETASAILERAATFTPERPISAADPITDEDIPL
jgi:hypothetical protein